jgi:hypothetical protein
MIATRQNGFLFMNFNVPAIISQDIFPVEMK